MKKLIILLVILMLIPSCKKKTYEGYYCNYTEQGVIIALLNKDISSSDEKTIDQKINSFEGLLSYDFIDRKTLGATDESDLYDTYFIYLNGSSNLESYLLDLQNTSGVYEATRSIVKSDVSLYNFVGKSYRFQNIIDGDNKINGTYKVRKNTIEFDSSEVPKIYLKDDFLCLDEDCNKILTKTNELCE